MDYPDMLDLLACKRAQGSRYGLSRMKSLMALLGHPEKSFKAIHIVGTNGKGSTLSFLDTILTHAGLRTARYTSPAVFDYRERFLISMKPARKEELASAFTAVLRAADSLEDQPSAFELETATAYLLFSQAHIDIALIEAGCGGRDDATNVLTSSIALITPISLDHATLLGSTIEEIAKVKADIIKNGSTALVAREEPSALSAIKKICHARKARLIITSLADLPKGIVLGLAGEYQKENAALACGVARLLGISEDDIAFGLTYCENPGRFEEIKKDPVVIIDGAHNPGAARALKESIIRKYPGRKVRFLMGIFKDKDYEKVVDEWLPIAQDFTTFTPPSPRALDARSLEKVIMKKGGQAKAYASIKDAVESILETSTKDDIIIATGSLSHLAIVRKEILHYGS